MGQLSPILRDAEGGRLTFWCPGCDEAHMIAHGPGSGPRWDWNGNADKPTFAPSIRVQGVKKLTQDQIDTYTRAAVLPEPVPSCCHSFVVDGRIQFLSDCTHALAGQTVDLPPWPKPPGE